MRAVIAGLGQWTPALVRGRDGWPESFAQAHASRAEAELTQVRANAKGDAVDRIVARHAAAEAGDPFLGMFKAKDSLHRSIAEVQLDIELVRQP